MEDVIQCHELLRRMSAVARLRAQSIYPTDDPLIEFRIQAHGVEHLGAVLQQPGNDFIDVADRKRIIRPIIALRARRPRAPAVPGLAGRIAFAYEHDVLGLFASRDQYSNGFRLGETRYVVKVAVLTIRIFHIVVAMPDWSCRQDRDGVATHEPGQLA